MEARLIRELPASERIERTVKCDVCGWHTPGVPQAESWALHETIATLRADATKAAEELARVTAEHKALLAAIDDCPTGREYLDADKLVSAFIKEQERLRAELARERERHQWIDVKQAMPPMTERIERDGLSYSVDVDVVDDGIVAVGYIAAFDEQPIEWIIDGSKRNSVSRWKLRPDPPALLEPKAEPAPVATGEGIDAK